MSAETPRNNPVENASRRRRRWYIFMPLIVLLALVLTTVYWLGIFSKDTGDTIAASHANARGIGHMEQFSYADAIREFELAHRLAENWQPARINLAIALYNSQTDENIARAIDIFETVLKTDPENPYAHFNLGVIYKYRGDYAKATSHFEATTRIDPTDAHAWLFLAQANPNSQESEESKKYFEKALQLNPALNAARYGLITHMTTAPEQQTKLLAEFRAFGDSNWEEESREKYTEFGRYASVISASPVSRVETGPLPMFEQNADWTVTFNTNDSEPKWTNSNAFGEDSAGNLRKAIRERFGSVLVRLDFNRDGKLDLLLLAGRIKNGEPRNLLIRNDGNGRFADVSSDYGLDAVPGALGCAVADYDNDGWPDILLTTHEGVLLLRNVEGKRFENRTQEAGLADLKGVYLSATWIDLDQDGDLDLLLAKYASTVPEALSSLSESATPAGGVVLAANVGVAPPSRADEPPPPLTTAFKILETPPAFSVPGAVVGFVALDVDGDKDVDIIVLADEQKPVTVLNDRLMKFRRSPESLDANPARWNGGLATAVNADEQTDLFLLASGTKPTFLVSQSDDPSEVIASRFRAGATDSTSLLSAQLADLDNDGHVDVVGVSSDGKPVLLQGDGQGKLTLQSTAFGPTAAALADVRAVACADFNGDCIPDLLCWSETGGFRFFPGVSNGNFGLHLQFTGKRDLNNAGSGQKNLRTNNDAIGSKIIVQTGPLKSVMELTSLSAGLGQSLSPLEIGLGKLKTADAVRIRWPDCVVQAELAVPACQPVTIGEINRKPTSCPVLMAWNGREWVYITDFLGGGALGEVGIDGSIRPPRPEESIKLESHQLGLRDGEYRLRIAEPMDEVLYMDHLRLDVIDHPDTTHIYPDERFTTTGIPPSQRILAFDPLIPPQQVRDHQERDISELLAKPDGKTVSQFARRSWLGFAEEHFIEFDFGDRLTGLNRDKPVHLILAGWTDYPYPESIYAATQAGVMLIPPVLEGQHADGSWTRLVDIGFPAGLRKVITVDVSKGIFQASRFRIRTNLQIHWDSLHVAQGTDVQLSPSTTKVLSLPVHEAELKHPGFVQEISDPTSTSIAYDPTRFESVVTTNWQGQLTKLGSVTELLQEKDDLPVVCGPGDEIEVRFDARLLPPLPTGWKRSFVLRTHGYCKDTAPFTLTAGSVSPIPHSRMNQYPCPERTDERFLNYLKTWNTRPASGGR